MEARDINSTLRTIIYLNWKSLLFGAILGVVSVISTKSLSDALPAFSFGLYLSLFVQLSNRSNLFFLEHKMMFWSEPLSKRDLAFIKPAARKKFGRRLESGISETRALLAAGVIVALMLLTFNRVASAIAGWIVYKFAPIDQNRATDVGLIFRRFSTSPASDSFCRSVSVASRGLCNFVTLQDSSYTGDGSVRRYGLAYILLFAPIPLILLGVGLSELRGTSFDAAATIASALFATAWFSLIYRRAQDFVPVYFAAAKVRIDVYVNAVTKGCWRDNGVHTLRCADIAWRKSVLYAIQRAGIVVICGSRQFLETNIAKNESLIWEIENTFAALDPSKCIFVWSTERGKDEAITRPSVDEFLSKLYRQGLTTPIDRVRRAAFVGFMEGPEVGGVGLPQSRYEQLRPAIIEALTAEQAGVVDLRAA